VRQIREGPVPELEDDQIDAEQRADAHETRDRRVELEPPEIV